jgi:hypothetical protein
MKRLVLLLAPMLCLGEMQRFLITSSEAGFVSVPIGFGPGGGRIWGTVELKPASSANITGLTQIFILSQPQQELWKPIIDDWNHDSDMIVDGSGLLSYYHSIFQNKFSFNITLLNQNPERYYIVVIFPQSVEIRQEIFGSLSVDWEQGMDKSRIQFQYTRLGDSITVMIGLLIVFISYYVIQYVLIRRGPAVSSLHYSHLLVFMIAAGFLLSWSQGLETESITGDRFGFWTNWVPSIYQKIFDIAEVLFYLITSLGWQTVRPQLSREEVQMMTAGSLVSLLIGLMEIRCGEDTVECGGLTSARMVVHMFAFLTVIVAFTTNLATLSEVLKQSSIASYDTGRIYIQYRKFFHFRNIFFLYIIQPMVSVVIRSDIIDWQDDWIFVTFFWSSKIALLMALAIVFRPRTDVPLIVEAAVRKRRQQRSTAQ